MPTYTWECITDHAPFAPRDGAGAIVFDEKMWLVGGWNPKDRENFPLICSNDVWCSEDGRAWACVKPNTFGTDAFAPDSDWEGRHTAGYVVHDGRMWIIGGDANQGHYQDDVWSSTDGITWTRVLDPVPWAPRALHYTAAHNDLIWILGGQTVPQFAPAVEALYADIWTSRDGAIWTELERQEPAWTPRGMIGGSAVKDGRIWLLGGGTYDTPRRPDRRFYSEVWSSADGIEWTRHLEDAPWHPRQYHEVCVFDDRLWVLEGYHMDGGNRNDVWHSSNGIDWEEVPDTPWAPRHAASVFVFKDALWMVAGNNMQSDAWRLRRA